MLIPRRSDSSRRSAIVVDAALARQLGDALDQAGLVDLVGDLGDDDAEAAAAHLLDVRHAAHHDRARVPVP